MYVGPQCDFLCAIPFGWTCSAFTVPQTGVRRAACHLLKPYFQPDGRVAEPS